MSSFQEAMEELEVPDDASPRRKMKAVCQWYLGDGSWANTFIDWARQAGYEVKEIGE